MFDVKKPVFFWYFFSGYQVKGAIDAPQDWRKALPRPTVTQFRHTYAGVAHEEKELISNTTRYGCNKNKNVAAHGAGTSSSGCIFTELVSSLLNNCEMQGIIKIVLTDFSEFRHSSVKIDPASH